MKTPVPTPRRDWCYVRQDPVSYTHLILAVISFALATVSLAAAQRLPEGAAPENYKLSFAPDLDKATFEGDETISIRVLQPTSEITLNAIDIDFHDVTITSGGSAQKAKVTPEKDKEMVVLAVEKPISAGMATVHITYAGILNDEMRGLYLGKDCLLYTSRCV